VLKQIVFFFLVTMAWIPLAAPVGGVENKGAEEIVIPSGKRGDVPFPHRQHQDKLQDCNICHGLFPQIPGSINTLKAEGKLASKQIMNKQCVKCHREKRQAGEPSGPISCNTCHDQE